MVLRLKCHSRSRGPTTGLCSSTRTERKRRKQRKEGDMATDGEFPPQEPETTLAAIPATHQGVIRKMYDRQRSINSFACLGENKKLWGDLCDRSNTSCYHRISDENSVKVRRLSLGFLERKKEGGDERSANRKTLSLIKPRKRSWSFDKFCLFGSNLKQLRVSVAPEKIKKEFVDNWHFYSNRGGSTGGAQGSSCPPTKKKGLPPQLYRFNSKKS